MGTKAPSSTTTAAATSSTNFTSTTNSTITTTTTTSSSTTTSIPQQAAIQVLEITIISAQDLAPVSKSMRTYAVVWVHQDRKLTTRVDNHGHANPTWNDKFAFCVDDEFLSSDASSVMVEIYTASWFRHNLVGTVRVLINNLIPPSSRKKNNFISTRFVALQVRRASGNPQGILNMGVSLVDNTMRCIPMYSDPSPSAAANGEAEGAAQEEKERLNAKIQLWRSRSDKSEDNINSDDFPPSSKGGSICIGSMINGSVYNGSAVNGNGSELCSDVGPSASVVAAAIAKGLYPSPTTTTTTTEEKRMVSRGGGEVEDGESSSILEDLTIEEAKAKGYKSKAARWRTEFPGTVDHYSDRDDSNHSRRHSDGGLFSCFVYGIEFSIKCGANNKNNNNNNNNRNKKNSGGTGGGKSMKRSPSHQNVSICCKNS
ncbi:hypothetical protein ACSBR1_034440 [Camellia fascicularis]